MVYLLCIPWGWRSRCFAGRIAGTRLVSWRKVPGRPLKRDLCYLKVSLDLLALLYLGFRNWNF